MQQLNYYTLEAVVRFLRSEYLEGIWGEAFSQQKDELVIGLGGRRGDGYLRVGCKGNFQYLTPQREYRRARSNTVNLFPEAEGRTIKEISLVQGERVILIELDDGATFILKLHGNRSNVLYRENGQIRALFRSGLKEDMHFDLPAPSPVVPDSERAFWEAIEATGSDDPFQGMRKAFRSLDKYFIQKIQDIHHSGAGIWEAVQQTLAEAREDRYYIVRKGELTGFMLFALDDRPARAIEGIEEALSTFTRLYYGTTYYHQERKQIAGILAADTRNWRLKMESAAESLEKLHNRRSEEELANILMANLHQIPEGVHSVELYDFYQDCPIRLKLDPDLTPQKNAEKYYQKHKDQATKGKYLRTRWEQARKRYQTALEREQAFSEVGDMKALKQFLKTHPLPKPEKEKNEVPFREFEKEGYTIWVGRNARNNDELTFHYAHKNDLWLHAKDVAGSHVIIRQQPGKNIPNSVLEYAAGLAGYYSGQKNNSLVSVSYTPRKYLRKSKRMAPGQVLVEREQVLLVPPLKPEGGEW